MRALKNIRSTIAYINFSKKILSCFVLFVLTLSANIDAQSIEDVEYFFGNDPGIGNGTLVTAAANAGDLTQTVPVSIMGLQAGFHTLTLRVKSDAEIWSLYHRKTFYIIGPEINDTPSNITAAEYWFGQDPGNGNGTEIIISGTPSDTIENFAIPLGNLEAGFHTVSLRVKNLNNTWSLYHSKTFYIIGPEINVAPSNIAAAEYWFGQDPGNGNGTEIVISGTPSDTIENFTIPLATLEKGFHTISLRVKNLDGTWSLYHRKTFYIIDPNINTPPSNLVTAEYWFGEDPGNGNGTPLTISGSPNEIIENYTIPLGALEPGFHTISIRVKNLDNTWSLYHRKRFFIISPEQVDPISPLTDAEFLYDAPLGFGTGTAVAITATANQDEYLIEVPTDMVDCGFHDVTLSVKNALGNYSLYQIAEDIEVFDAVPPTIVVFPNIIAELDDNGQASITITDVNNGTFDDCVLISVVLNQAQIDYTCADLGPNTVTVTATDDTAKVSTLDVTITVVDNINPVAISQDITIQLDDLGNITTTADAVDDSSTDNCTITAKSLDISSFTCDDLGDNTVTLTVTDQSGNQNSTTAIVTVEDNVNPVAIGQNITIQLDATGNATANVDSIDDNSTDNCTITNRELDITEFTCDDLGDNDVVLTVTDQSGNQDSTTSIVTIEDNINPVAISQNITVQLDDVGNASIISSDIDNNSTDNCFITDRSLDITDFTCDDLGENTVILTVTDQSGNQHATTAIVIVEDNINPIAIGQDITVQLDSAGNASTTAVAIDNNSIDNCMITILDIDVSNFTCDDLGDNTITLTVIDQSGNQNETTVTVTVEDNMNPIATTQNITIQLDDFGNVTTTPEAIDNNSTDNCMIVDRSLDITDFNCDDLGDNTITLTVTDQSGNQNTATAIITVEDNVNPIAIAQNITIQLDPNGNISTTADDVDNGSTDNCTIVSKSINITDFTCDDLGNNTVVLTITDQSGNQSTANATVTVVDNIDPIAIGQNIIIQLDATGNATTTANDVDNGSTDNCMITDFFIDTFSFTCDDLGDNSVILTVEDQSGNRDTTTVTVTVEDSINPIAITQNITIQLDNSGSASTTPEAIDDNSNDNCTIVNRSLDIIDFTCNDLGDNTVMLTVTDQSGNVNTTSALVTVEDNINPVAIANDIIIQLDINGNITTTADDVDNGSTDNCMIVSKSLDITDFSCDNVGVNTVVFTVIDQSGNEDSINITVTVEDTIDPVAITQNVTIQLDAFGNATTTANDIDNGSTDNCMIASLSLDISNFTCDDLGDNTVALTVTDQSGNQDTATAIVTIEDTIDPTVTGQNITIQLDNTGNATITVDDVDNNSTDNCMAISSVDITSFDCNDLGANTVTLTVADQSGNQATTTVIVIVEDNINPVANAQDIVVELDASGNVSISVDDVDNTSTDNCTIVSRSLDITDFTCADVGVNTVTLTIIDQSGNEDTATVTVTVVELINPVANGQELTIELDTSGNASITADDVDDNSTDNCGIMSKSIDISNFTCDDIGDNLVVLTITDVNGNEDTETVTISVVDIIDPIALGQDITVNLDGNLSVSIAASNVDNGSNDNCNFNLSIDVDTFTATGEYPIILTVTDTSGNTDDVSVIVTVIDEIICSESAIWTASGWDISPAVPTTHTSVIIMADYDTDVVGANIDACTLTIDVGVIVTVAAGDYIQVAKDITVNGDLIVAHEGSLVQIDDNAIVTNNGIINVNVTTAEVDTRDFVMLGSPMDLESRDDVWATAFNVQEFVPSLFVPFGPQEAGVMYNFQSTSLDVWDPKSGILEEGEGYLVFPQEGYTAPGGQFNYIYDTGTLNNGVILRTLTYNGTQESSPHMLANPYASAIDADVFFSENTTIDAVYFWEHGATSSTSVPGPEARNFTMRDVSAYNSTGGVMSASGAGTIPNGIIATAQGFGVFASVEGPVSFNNSMRVKEGNNTLRTNDIQKDRLWLRVEDLTYGEGSNALVGFISGATEGIDSKYDSGAIENVVSLYSYIDDDFSLGYTIQGREPFNLNDSVKMGFNTLIDDEVTYKIALSDFDGSAWEDAIVYLVDNDTGIVTNLNTNAYNFTAIKGVYKNRFLLKFQDRMLDTNDNTLSNVTIYPNPTESILNIANPDKIVLESMTIYDLMGRVVKDINLTKHNAEINISVRELAGATYLINIKTSTNQIIKKLVVK